MKELSQRLMMWKRGQGRVQYWTTQRKRRRRSDGRHDNGLSTRFYPFTFTGSQSKCQEVQVKKE